MATLICVRCGYGTDPNRPWITRLINEKPKQCPRCKQLSWEKGLQPRAKKEK